MAKAREERLKAAQAEKDAKLRELYAGRLSSSYFIAPIAPIPYAPVSPGGQSNLIYVMITDGSAELDRKFYPLRIAPFVMAPCEVKEVGVYTSSSWLDYKVWVGYIPPALYWDVSPPADKEGLSRYVSCDGDQLMKASYARPVIIPISGSPVRIDRHKGRRMTVSGLTVTFTNANAPLPLTR